MLRKNRKERHDQRRVEANVRQEEYDALTPEQKIVRAQASPGNSKRELRRFNVDI